MSTGVGILQLARQHIGEQYDHVLVPKNNPNWHGPWDCSEFASWCVFQDAQILYGCDNDHGNPAAAKAYSGNWERDIETLGISIPVEQAAATIGAVIVRYPPGPGTMGHVVISDGQGGTVEAKGKAYGVVTDTLQNRRWDRGVMIHGIYYSQPSRGLTVNAPAQIYYPGAPNMDPNVVRRIQQALAAVKIASNPDRFLDPGPIDGIYGAKTVAAVHAFQLSQGLVTDGEVGAQTAQALGIVL